MSEKTVYENASQRKTYVGRVFDMGERQKKKEILDSLPAEWAELHRDGHIHIHDLDAYGLTYNCLTFNLLNKFPYRDFIGLSDNRKILGLFEYYKNIVSKVGNEQSGGMGFANFDNDTAEILTNMSVKITQSNLDFITDCIAEFILWCNGSHERMGQVSYYVTLNIGLAKNDLARHVCRSVISEFYNSPDKVFKPNIVFKVKKGINHDKGDRNRDLLEESLLCTAKKMIPTYILCDCESNRDIDPELLSIMGCRTRVVKDIYGHTGSRGRGNICNISINLPRLALETINESSEGNIIARFKEKWLRVAETTKDILIHRYTETLKMEKSDFPTVNKYDLWIEDFSKNNTLEDIFKHGTLSIGFIGISEAFEILTGKKYYSDPIIYQNALDFVKFMRSYTDSCTEKYKLNFSLLATSGELISGRFCEIDQKLYDSPVMQKGYYTNSFHVDVDSGLSAIEKIGKEGPFHSICNGGCITYIELNEAPLGNKEGLLELIDCAIQSGTHYLGVNFPLDICNDCGEKGVFDTCPGCGSGSITRVRRVSGYLEILDYFVSGKKAEVAHRRSN